MRRWLSIALLLQACQQDKPDTGSPPADTGPYYQDADGDGYDSRTDCDDANPYIHPDATEICADGVDNDCDGNIDAEDDTCQHTQDTGQASPIDSDLDGYSEQDGDCDDDDISVNPGADEVCGDGIDNDCDGATDDGSAVDATLCYQDTDGDGFGDSTAAPVSACECGAGLVQEQQDGQGQALWDCDDGQAAVNPLAAEVCNGQDDDCDGVSDEPDAEDAATWYQDLDGDGYGDPEAVTLACQQPEGFVAPDDAGDDDCDDSSARAHPGADEACDCPSGGGASADDDGLCTGRDDDCDGETDEGSALDAPTWYRDQDEDTYGDALVTVQACHEAPTGYVADATDCDDYDANIWPGADEYCDGADNDCDGAVDEDDALDAAEWYADDDGDGFGDNTHTLQACYQPTGYVADTTGFDCDDTDPAVNPDAWESCNDIDDDCDGLMDEGEANGATTWYLDDDGDGYGGTSSLVRCDQPTSYVPVSGDCDDSTADAYPGNSEVHCDGIDNDCDSGTADSGTETCFDGVDDDCDGYDSNDCLFVDATEVSIPSPGDGSTAYEWAVGYPSEAAQVIGFLAPSAVTESTADTCDFSTTVTDDTTNHEVVFSITLDGCGTAPRTSNGLEAQAVVMATITGSPRVFATPLEQTGTGSGTAADSPSSGFTASVDPFCALLTSQGDGATAFDWSCVASFDGTTLSGALDVANADTGSPQVAVDLVALALGGNAVAELLPFSCQVTSGVAGSDSVTHTPDPSLGSDTLALVLPQSWSPSNGDDLSLYAACSPRTTSHTCIVECSGNGSSSLVEGWILYLDGTLH